MKINELDEYIRNNSKISENQHTNTYLDLMFKEHINPLIPKKSQHEIHQIMDRKWEIYLDDLILKLDYLLRNDPHYSTSEWIKFIEDTNLLNQLEIDLYNTRIGSN